jgi:hypothetical protein
MDNPEYQEQPKPKEKVFNQYGVYVVTENDAYEYSSNNTNDLSNPENTVIVSQPDWEYTLKSLMHNKFGSTTVITPELITVANKPWEEIAKSQSSVQKELDKIAAISALQPDATFVIGSPYFPDPDQLPFNSAVIFKEGKVIGHSDKKLLGDIEGKYFQCDPQAVPLEIDGLNILVCRDLIGAQQTRIMTPSRETGVFRNTVSEYVKVTTGNEDLANQYINAPFLTPGAKKLLITACWGTGAPKGFLDNSPQSAVDEIYFYAMEGRAVELLKKDLTLKQVIVCDRVPNPEDENPISSIPFNAVFFK